MRYVLSAGVLLLLSWADSAEAGSRRSLTIRPECVGQRCVLRDQFGTRLGTVTREDTGRLRVEDERGRLRGKVTRDDDGTLRIEKARIRR